MSKSCECGCGELVAPGRRYRWGHNRKHSGTPQSEYPDPNPSGLCMCGCGERTSISPVTSLRHQRVKGRHVRFVSGHHSRVIVGPDRAQWKGGRIITGEGYAKVRVERDGKRRYVAEHRLVMEQQLGRRLEPHEQVHHINGDKLDNRPENLELWKRQQPSGVRSVDYHCPGCRCNE